MFNNKLYLSLIVFSCLTFSCKNEDQYQFRNIQDQNFKVSQSESDETSLFQLLDTSVTRMTFINKLTETNDQNYKSYAYIYNGGGVAVGDINNDGLLDVFMGGNMVSGRMYLNKGNFRFDDITATSGLLNDIGFKTGVNMVDINNDGFLDIYICAGGRFKEEFRKNLLYINNGDLTFTESAAKYGLDDASFSTQSYFFDMDMDGDLDLYLLNHPFDPRESNNLKLNSDKDGNLSIVLSPDLQHVSDRLYRNDNGKFMDITEKSGVLNEAFGLSAIIADFNEDLLPDIYVCNDYVKPDYLYINNGDGTFTDRFNDYFQHTSFSSMGSDYADINNDGCLDLFTLDMFPEDNERQKMHGTEYNYDKYLLTKKVNFATQFIKNTLQLNNCDGTYSDIAMFADVAHTDWSWSVLMADYDNDGWKDIFVTNGYRRSVTDNDYVKYKQDSILKLMKTGTPDIRKFIGGIPTHKTKNYLYRNNGNLSFSNVSDSWDSGPPEFSNGAVYADLDNDGYLDLIVNNLDTLSFLFKNTGKQSRANNFVRFSLNSPSPIYGAKVEITDSEGSVQTQVFYPNRGFISHVEPILHFGLGKSKGLSEVKITWPDGNIQIVENVNLNQLNKIDYIKGSESFKKIRNPNLYFEPSSVQLHPDMKHTENEYIDFKREPLLHRKYSESGPALAVADINGDGLDDVYLGGASGYSGKIFLRKKNGSFEKMDVPSLETDHKFEDIAAVFADFNGDKNLDLLVVSGGNEFTYNSPDYLDRLYIGDGKGGFKRDESAMPRVVSSGSCIALWDIDGDGDLDVFIGGRVSPGKYPAEPVNYIMRNDNGKFVNITTDISEGLNKVGMVTSAQFSDLDKDGVAELILVGEWMSPKIFKFIENKYIDVTEKFGLAEYKGWWEGILIKDLNNDGYPEIIAGNTGLNGHFKASRNKPVTLHYKDYDGNGTTDPILCHYVGKKSYPVVMRDKLLDHMVVLKKKFLRYYQYSTATIAEIFTPDQRKDESVLEANHLATTLFWNQEGKSFKAELLPVSAQLSTMKTILDYDVNNDGFSDIIMGGNEFGTDVLLGRYDASPGVLLLGDKSGNLKNVTPANSGLSILGNVRKMAILKHSSKTELLIVRNNDVCTLLNIRIQKENN
ncbi:MAG: VCBS repeat-containing protein [Saprospiraceae bacterium]|nr:VCBS repeat-containing protein [Saprospiraceae bacterium]